jgi:hypothetical protein
LKKIERENLRGENNKLKQELVEVRGELERGWNLQEHLQAQLQALENNRI